MLGYRNMETHRYYWVVTCKNIEFHGDQNPFALRRIALAETDEPAPHPSAIGRFSVRCDECGREYSYEAQDILKWIGKPTVFTPHPQLN